MFEEIVEFAGLQAFIDSPVKVYSSGMYVRLGFAVAVHVDPDILMIDEVIAVGDEEFQRRCFDHLFKLRRSGVTIVIVSHMLSIMQTMCDRVAWLDHGVMQGIGAPADMVRGYLGQVDDAEERRLSEHEGHEVTTPGGTSPARKSRDRDHALRGARTRRCSGPDAGVGESDDLPHPLRHARAGAPAEVRRRLPDRGRRPDLPPHDGRRRHPHRNGLGRGPRRLRGRLRCRSSKVCSSSASGSPTNARCTPTTTSIRPTSCGCARTAAPRSAGSSGSAGVGRARCPTGRASCSGDTRAAGSDARPATHTSVHGHRPGRHRRAVGGRVRHPPAPTGPAACRRVRAPRDPTGRRCAGRAVRDAGAVRRST